MRRGTCLAAAASLALALASSSSLFAGDINRNPDYKVLAPISQGNLTIFPVVASSVHDAAQFLTLDEGLRSGEVVVTEAGRVQGLIRRPGQHIENWRGDGAQVNRLVLVNNSKRPLLLLAGEIVTGGKQDRVIGKDRIVPAMSDPIDLSVFCVEPGRWTGASMDFKPAMGATMAQPSVRAKAMAEQNQQQVWDQVRSSNAAAMTLVEQMGLGSHVDRFRDATSYARVMAAPEVQTQVDKIAAPIARNYEETIRELRQKNAVGVVVAVGGRIIWADIFASTALLQKYWPKLARSYATEALVSRASSSKVDTADADRFLGQLAGNHEVVDSEPGVYRHTEISGSGFKAFELTALLPGTGFDLHLAKMAE